MNARNVDIQPVNVRRANPFAVAPHSRYRRVCWDDPDQLYAMVLVAFGISHQVAADKTGLTIGQVRTRAYKAGIRTTDYRNMRGNNTGASIARGVIGELAKRYENVVKDKLPYIPPTKKESKRNGNGTALTLAHAGRGLAARDASRGD
jgi:hypothetical protein